MICVTIEKVYAGSTARIRAKVTAENIEAAVQMFPGAVVFPITGEEFFAPGIPGIETLEGEG